MDAGCKDCIKRRIGCHSTCGKYTEFKLNNENMKKEKSKNNILTERRIKKLTYSKRMCRNY